MKDPVQILEHAMNPIVNEMFQNGPEEGNRIWVDWNHPLNQAIRVLLRAQLQLQYNEAADMLEQHRQMEEGA